jgi:probable phosphoglycerate mutase
VTALLVVRHGQSTWNADGRWQGQADPPLSALGEAQAADAARMVDGCIPIWASDLARASRTAGIIAARAGGAAPLDVVLDARLRERDAGEWTGLTRAEIDERHPGALREGRRPPGFEPDESLAARALPALEEFAAGLPADGVGLVVTHGGLIRVVERELGADPEPVPNLGGRRVLVERSGLVLGERVLLLDPGSPGIQVTVPRQI